MREDPCRPYGTRNILQLYPALTRWANECRRFAAGIVGAGLRHILFPRPSHSSRFTFRVLCFFGVVFASVATACALDRESFSFTQYDLNVQVEPEQHRLGVRGKITLRNDTTSPQKIAVLQISSSLDWRSIKSGDKALQFVTQQYTSDIDHTGSLSEAIVTLPKEVAPHGTVDLEVGYEGVVLLDATRLTRIGTPHDAAKSTDWDEIATKFTGVRGVGHVVWYPIATDVANLSEGESLFEALARWKMREAGSTAHIKITVSGNGGQVPRLVASDPFCIFTNEAMGQGRLLQSDCNFRSLAVVVPSFVGAGYGEVDRPSIHVYNLATHAAAAETYADTAEKLVPLITDWFGAQREKAQTVDLPDSNDAPFESGAFLLTPLAASDSKLVGLAAAHQLTHASFLSFRPWIEEGLAHFAQALYLEQQRGRQAALDYMGAHRSAVSAIEPSTSPPGSEDEASHSLVNTTSEELYRSKAMCVWWMLRDMIGDAALKKAIAAYKPEQDKEPSYMPRLIAAQTQRDLEWFFDDWVYRDHGLPDFKVESAFARKTMNGAFMLTITVANLGSAGAEVPVVIRSAGGTVTKRIEVRAKAKATVRVEMPAVPQEIVVNDGSVPESDTTNNTFKVEAPQG